MAVTAVRLDGVIFIGGPTGAGKSSVAYYLAHTMAAEIVAVDSMQVYRGLEIGTAKPSERERAELRHHLIDVLELTETCDAAAWVKMAKVAIEDIRRRGRVAILCGGSGLYLKSLLEGLGESPGSDPKLRQELEETPLPELLRELQTKDPVTWERIDKKNPRRVIRAVEVIRLSSRAYSQQRANWREGNRGAESSSEKRGKGKCFFGLDRDRQDLRRRIDERVESMFERGLVDETERLIGQGLTRNRTAMQAIGYRQVIEYLRGCCSLAETIASVKQRTWQLARRQLNWFRNQMELEWVRVHSGESPETVAGRLASALGLER